MPEAKQFGRPRKTPAGGQTVTFYLPKDVVSWIKEKGGARIRQQAYKAMEQSGEKMNEQKK